MPKKKSKKNANKGIFLAYLERELEEARLLAEEGLNGLIKNGDNLRNARGKREN
jgi:hypothetical protein